jgi:hypothetical protein
MGRLVELEFWGIRAGLFWVSGGLDLADLEGVWMAGTRLGRWADLACCMARGCPSMVSELVELGPCSFWYPLMDERGASF